MSTHTDAMSENAKIETGSNADPKAPGDPSGESVLGATPCSHKRITDIIKERGWSPLPAHLREDRIPTVSGENTKSSHPKNED